MRSRYSVSGSWLLLCLLLLSWIKPGFAQHKVLSSLEEDITSLVESIKPSLVTIETEGHVDKGRRNTSTLVGSGIIYTSDGYILTTASVVRGMRDFKVTLPGQESVKGKLVGIDEESNLAVLKVEADGLVPAKFGDSDKIRVGSWLTVVGNSYGLPNAVALGLVNGVREDGFIQMSANVSPGNSGGPVLDTYGRVIGLVCARLSEPSFIGSIKIYSGRSLEKAFAIPTGEIEIPSSGVSLALPSNKVRLIADEIIKHGSVKRGYLGIYPENLDERTCRRYNLRSGVMVNQVVKRSPAEMAGILDGDVILKFGGTEVKNVAHIRQLIRSRRAGEPVKLKILRDGKKIELTAILGEAKPVYHYSWLREFDLQIPSFDFSVSPVEMSDISASRKPDQESLEQLREKLQKLEKRLKKLNEELEELKLERSKE